MKSNGSLGCFRVLSPAAAPITQTTAIETATAAPALWSKIG